MRKLYALLIFVLVYALWFVWRALRTPWADIGHLQDWPELTEAERMMELRQLIEDTPLGYMAPRWMLDVVYGPYPCPICNGLHHVAHCPVPTEEI